MVFLFTHKGTFIPSLSFAMLEPRDLFYCTVIHAGICKTAALPLWTFIQAALLWQMESKSPQWRLRLFLNCAEWSVLFHKEEAKLWRSYSHIWEPVLRDIYGWLILQYNKTLTRWDFWPGTSQTTTYFSTFAFTPVSVLEPDQSISDWKRNLVLKFLLKINR